LTTDHLFRNLFFLCENKNCFVYEHLPDLFGDELTVEELEYWLAFDTIKAAEMHNISYEAISYSETLTRLERANYKRKAELEQWNQKTK